MSALTPRSVVVPGDCICTADENRTAGDGTYRQGEYIFSSLTGFVDYKEDNKEIVVEVNKGFERTIVPTVGSVVTAKVVNIRRRFAKCLIYCVESTVLKEPFRGMLRKEDVRAKEKDKVEMYKCYRPGDIILARITSIGTMHSYNLSTAEEELGVVFARSEAGFEMTPTSWSEMMCTKTFVKEPRKIAKVVPQNISMENFAKLQKEFNVNSNSD